MKTLLVFLLACLLVGCSGGRQAVPSTRGTATAELVIQFPKASTRAIPTATQSVVVSPPCSSSTVFVLRDPLR